MADVGRNKKQSMAELKLRRLNELNARLKEDLERRRIPVSEAANEYGTAIGHKNGHMLIVFATVSSTSLKRNQKTSWSRPNGDM